MKDQNQVNLDQSSKENDVNKPHENKLLIWIVGGALLVVIALAAGLAVWKGFDALKGGSALGDNAAAVSVITMKSGDVSLAEAQPYFESLVLDYEYDGVDVTNEQTLSELKETALKYLAQEHVALDQIEKRNLGQVTDEDKKKAIDGLDAELREVAQYNESYFNPDGTLTPDEVLAELQKYFDSMGMTRDVLESQTIQNIPYNRLLDEITKDVKVTDEQIQQSFDEEVATAKAEFGGDVYGYEITKMFYGADIPYVPAGYRGVRHILLAIPENLKTELEALQSKLNLLQSELSDLQGPPSYDWELTEESEAEATPTPEAAPAATPNPEIAVKQAEVDAKQKEIDALIASIPDALSAEIETVKQRLASGESFAKLVEELGTDPGMTQEPQKTGGYEVHAESIQYDDTFRDAAMALKNIGDISEPVASQFGVHFIEYTRDVPEGALPLSDDKRKEIEDQMLQDAQQTAVNAQFDAWFVEYEVVMHPELLSNPASGNAPVQTN